MKRIRLSSAGILLFSLLSACTTLGPDYQEPTVDWAEDWDAGVYGDEQKQASGEQGDLAFWWKAFNDPLLNQLIEIARRENPDLRIAGLRIAQSRAQLGIALGSRYPQVQQATGTLTRVDTWPTEGDNSGSNDNFNNYGVDFNVAWELDFWGRFQRGIESADAAFFASITNQQNAQVLLSAQVAQSYFSYLTSVRQIEIARQNADLQKRSYDITRQLYESGQDSELDLQQARTQYLATLATIPGLEISVRQVQNALGILLARPPGQMQELDSVAGPLPELDPFMISEVPVRLLMRRPDIRTSAWQVAAQSAQIGIAMADLYPSLSLLGTVGWSGNSLNSTVDTATTGIGPSFTWNLFNYGRIEDNVRVQDALLQQALERYQGTVLQAAREIDDAAISVIKTREQGVTLSESLISAERALKLSTTRYREGYSNFQRVLDAQSALAAQSTNQVTAQGAHLNAVVAFYKALGGGWTPATAEQIVPSGTRDAMQQRTDWGDMLEAAVPQPPQSPQGGTP